tara:strand:- start:1927 stop:2100 length:174 start_codon:yes stop_codon:yes gene_type:complete
MPIIKPNNIESKPMKPKICIGLLEKTEKNLTTIKSKNAPGTLEKPNLPNLDVPLFLG